MTSLSTAKSTVYHDDLKKGAHLDLLDQELIRLFAARYKLLQSLTADNSLLNEEFKKFRIEQRAQWANDFGLDRELFLQIYKLLED